jgi:hypothetical protein
MFLEDEGQPPPTFGLALETLHYALYRGAAQLISDLVELYGIR